MLKIDIRNLIRAISKIEYVATSFDRIPYLYLNVFYAQNGITMVNYESGSVLSMLFDQEYLLKDLNQTFRIELEEFKDGVPSCVHTDTEIQAKQCTTKQWVNHAHKLLVNMNPDILFYEFNDLNTKIKVAGNTCHTEVYSENE